MQRLWRDIGARKVCLTYSQLYQCKREKLGRSEFKELGSGHGWAAGSEVYNVQSEGSWMLLLIPGISPVGSSTSGQVTER